MKIRTLHPTSLILLMLATGAQAAEIYKWTGEDGTVHYGQSPPNGVLATPLEKKMPSSEQDSEAARGNLEKRLEAFEERRDAREMSEEERARAAEEKAVRKENCEQSRKNLETLQSRGQASIKEGDDYRKLTEEERQSKIEEYQGHVKEFCGSG